MTQAPPTTTADSGREPEPWELYHHAHHWRAQEDEYEGGKLGMWLFLSTEILLFSGFFCAYAVFRMLYPGNWASASAYYLSWPIGAVNTLVLVLSSFTIVMAIRNVQLARHVMANVYLAITWLCAAFFLVVKLGWEYFPKIQKGELPGAFFKYPGSAGHGEGHAAAEGANAALAQASAAADPAIVQTAAAAGDHADFIPASHDQIFLSVYWIATATHGFHVFVGMIVIAMCMWKVHKREQGPKNFLFLENTGLYWHIVDLVWIFLFPMLYLV